MLKRVALLRQLCTGSGVPAQNGLITYIDTKAKCRHLKKTDLKRDFAAGGYLSEDPSQHPPPSPSHTLSVYIVI
jgi:hypothetical protein